MNRSLPMLGLALPLLFGLLQNIQPWLLFERDAINQGAYWRLLSAHLVHTNWPHLALNSAAWVLFLLLCAHLFRAWQLVLLITVFSIGISVLLLYQQPQLYWYAGFSGVLYGLFLVGGVRLVLSGERLLGTALVLAVLGKTAWDFIQGGNAASAQLIEAPVVLAAHGYGLLLGATVAIGLVFKHFLSKRH